MEDIFMTLLTKMSHYFAHLWIVSICG